MGTYSCLSRTGINPDHPQRCTVSGDYLHGRAWRGMESRNMKIEKLLCPHPRLQLIAENVTDFLSNVFNSVTIWPWIYVMASVSLHNQTHHQRTVLGNPMADHKVIAPLPGTTVPAVEEIRKTSAAAGRNPPHRDLWKQGDGCCYSFSITAHLKSNFHLRYIILVILILSAWDSLQMRLSLSLSCVISSCFEKRMLSVTHKAAIKHFLPTLWKKQQKSFFPPENRR